MTTISACSLTARNANWISFNNDSSRSSIFFAGHGGHAAQFLFDRTGSDSAAARDAQTSRIEHPDQCSGAKVDSGLDPDIRQYSQAPRTQYAEHDQGVARSGAGQRGEGRHHADVRSVAFAEFYPGGLREHPEKQL